MELERKTRRLIVAGGVVLLLAGLAVWLLPVLISHDAVVRERVQQREGAMINTTIKQPFDLTDLHWEPVAIVLLGLGGTILVVGVVPLEWIASLRTPLGEIRLSKKDVEGVIERTQRLAPGENLPQVAAETLVDISDQRMRGRSLKQIDRTISRIIEEEEAAENGEE